MPSYITGGFTGVGVSPGLSSAEFTSNGFLKLTFSEPMNTTLANNALNYSVNGGVTVLSAAIQPKSNDTIVLLTIAGYEPVTTYTITVNNLTDKAGNLIV